MATSKATVSIFIPILVFYLVVILVVDGITVKTSYAFLAGKLNILKVCPTNSCKTWIFNFQYFIPSANEKTWYTAAIKTLGGASLRDCNVACDRTEGCLAFQYHGQFNHWA